MEDKQEEILEEETIEEAPKEEPSVEENHEEQPEEEKEEPVEEKQEEKKEEPKEKPKKKGKFGILFLILVLVAGGCCAYVFRDKLGFGKKPEEGKITTKEKTVTSEYRMNGNDLQDFDIKFMQLENNGANKIYSPLSIKYALAMLNEGSNGETKNQITAVIGDYKTKKYTNSKNLSLANGLFIQENFKDSVKKKFVDNLMNKYNAEVYYDSFASPNVMNNWVEEKTFGLVKDLVDDASGHSFFLINALAIDMDWVNVFQKEHDDYSVSYKHENFYTFVPSLESGYASLDFNNASMKAKAVKVGGEANRYDIIKTLGEQNIRDEVGKEYKEFLDKGACGNPESEPTVEEYLDKYMKELGSNYKSLSSSTDFMFNDDEDVKVFAKDLKTYDGTTLQYIGIMPKKGTLNTYVKNSTAESLNKVIKSLKPIELESFKDGVVTKIVGSIPVFQMEYQLQLIDDLQKMGITDVFDINKADLTGINSTKGLYIDKAIHKANIEFSNEGIKAAAATAMGGKGATGCWFDHVYEVPVEELDLTFDNPYLYFVRDKDSGEVWFAGTVYEPTKYEMPTYR